MWKDRIKTVEYSSVHLCVCMCVCVGGGGQAPPCLCLCVFFHDHSKRNSCWNMKLEYIVVYEKSLDEFGIDHSRIMVKVTIGLQRFSPFTTIQSVMFYNPTLAQAKKLILSMYVHLILIYKIDKYRHA